jgi:hypothetical protein
MLLRDVGELGEQDRLQVVGLEADFRLGHRDEAPVLLPGVVVDVLDDVELAVELREVHEAHRDVGALADQLGDAVDAHAVEVPVGQHVGDQVHRLREAGFLDERT